MNFKAINNLLVGDGGLEPPTSTMSTWRSPPELIAHFLSFKVLGCLKLKIISKYQQLSYLKIHDFFIYSLIFLISSRILAASSNSRFLACFNIFFSNLFDSFNNSEISKLMYLDFRFFKGNP